MGSPCEILIDTEDILKARDLFNFARKESARIEKKYSRYITGNIVDKINKSCGQIIETDSETSNLLDFAQTCFELSEGRFDITTGVLRKIWKFDGRKIQTLNKQVMELKEFVGWNKIKWQRPYLTLPAGFEIDLGGICKEYAADLIANSLFNENKISLLVNLGGDISAKGTRPWMTGIEDISSSEKVKTILNLTNGALATSGDTKRYAFINGQHSSHILNPLTGFPVSNPPKSVTIAAATCTEAGFISTLAMLHGENAESFLRDQNIKFWCYR